MFISYSFKDLLIELGACKLHLEGVRELFSEAPPHVEKVREILISINMKRNIAEQLSSKSAFAMNQL